MLPRTFYQDYQVMLLSHRLHHPKTDLELRRNVPCDRARLLLPFNAENLGHLRAQHPRLIQLRTRIQRTLLQGDQIIVRNPHRLCANAPPRHQLHHRSFLHRVHDLARHCASRLARRRRKHLRASISCLARENQRNPSARRNANCLKNDCSGRSGGHSNRRKIWML